MKTAARSSVSATFIVRKHVAVTRDDMAILAERMESKSALLSTSSNICSSNSGGILGVIVGLVDGYGIGIGDRKPTASCLSIDWAGDWWQCVVIVAECNVYH